MRSRHHSDSDDVLDPVRPDVEPYTSPCWFLIFEAVCIAPGVFTLVWVIHYAGGLAWDGSHKQFNWHPLCMVLGIGALFSNGLVAFQLLPFRRRCRKVLHALINLTTLLFVVVGLAAVFENHQKNDIPHLYSLHSWCGIIFLALYFMQWLAGFIGFVLPIIGHRTRTAYKPLHVRAGVLIFVLAVATCLVGLTEKMLFLEKDPHYSSTLTKHGQHHDVPFKYSALPPQAQLVNVIGLSLLVLAAVVVVLISQGNHTPKGQGYKFLSTA